MIKVLHLETKAITLQHIQPKRLYHYEGKKAKYKKFKHPIACN